MSLVLPLLSTDNDPIALGTVVVLSAGKVRAFDDQTDVEADVLGVVVPKLNNVIEYVTQSPYYYNIANPNGFNAYFEYTFVEGGNNTENPNYNGSYDWTTDDACQAVMVMGIAAVLNSNSGFTKTSWKLLEADSVTSAYLIN